MNFESSVAWLDRHLGRSVSVAISGPSDSDTSSTLAIRGELRPGTGEWTLIDPREGESRGYDIGESGSLLIRAGDFLAAESLDDDAIELELNDLQLIIALL